VVDEHLAAVSSPGKAVKSVAAILAPPCTNGDGRDGETMALREALVDEQLILDRERLGIDRWDECWSGVYVMSPPPRQPHQRATRRLAEAFEALGLAEVDTAVGVGDARDYRVPDVVVYEAHALDDEALFLRSALVVVEVVSPTEDPHAKLRFYEDHVEEVLLGLRDRIELFSRDSEGLRQVEPTGGWLIGEHVAAHLDTAGLLLALPDRSQIQFVAWP
jgi:Uma2 family endonuclease